MKTGTLNLNTTTQNILDKFISEVRQSGLSYFSKGYKTIPGYYMVQCPYHKNGQERTPSAQFRQEDALFYCFVCKVPHSIEDVISYCLNVNGRSWLLNNFDGDNIEDRTVDFGLPKPTEKIKPKSLYVDKSILTKYKHKHPYMYERKLTDEVMEKFDIGYDPEKECITFPNKDVDGNIRFIATRSVNKKFFHYPEGVDKVIYGLYEIYQEIKRGVVINEIYVCESMINALTIWGWGKYAIALNGTGSTTQVELLKKTPFRQFILALDPDNAGRRGTEKLIAALGRHKILRTLPVPEGNDINTLTQEQFESLVPEKPAGFML